MIYQSFIFSSLALMFLSRESLSSLLVHHLSIGFVLFESPSSSSRVSIRGVPKVSGRMRESRPPNMAHPPRMRNGNASEFRAGPRYNAT